MCRMCRVGPRQAVGCVGSDLAKRLIILGKRQIFERNSPLYRLFERVHIVIKAVIRPVVFRPVHMRIG